MAEFENLATLRAAHPDEYADLSALALRSKGHWGYSPSFLEACVEELTVGPKRSEQQPVFLLEVEQRVVGFYGLDFVAADVCELDYLFVEPDMVGRGYGRQLMTHAKRTARDRGCRRIVINGDPNAEGFYLAAGGTKIGFSASGSIPGRRLPVFEILLD